MRRVVTDHAARAPRSLQLYLGPSELGVECDRQVAGKMAGVPKTNHVMDPWPSIVGTAVHAWLADAFTAHNARTGVLRWITEQRVTPHDNHPGTGDLYDAVEQTVGDHKVLGESTLAKVRAASGPPRKYQVQLLLYALGFRRLGLPVRRVALIAYPRTSSSLDGLYVWERPYTPADDELIAVVFQQTAHRQELAKAIHAGQLRLEDVPPTPSSDECFFCPFYRPESSRDAGPGCPGTVRTA
ncbi:hypothetical protein BAY59_10885 [Prauserella coralliicola]|nr:hypothetical protein BAY59_10885 [Prauserella coralliicola]